MNIFELTIDDKGATKATLRGLEGTEISMSVKERIVYFSAKGYKVPDGFAYMRSDILVQYCNENDTLPAQIVAGFESFKAFIWFSFQFPAVIKIIGGGTEEFDTIIN